VKTLRNSEAKTIPSRTTVGLDVGDRHSWFCILDEAGEVVAEGRVRTTSEALNEHFTRWARSRVVLEAGTSSAWISRLAMTAGHEVIVANPRELRKIHQSDRKNDRSDAQVLARMARFDPQLLAPITHRSAAMQNDLAVVRARDVLVRARTQCVNAVRGLVKTAGGRLTTCGTECFARKAVAQLPSGLESALGPMLKTIESLTEQIRAYDRVIDELASRYPVTEVLRQVTGVGALTAVTYALTLGDSSRFGSSRDIGAYLGLVPRQHDSGNHVSQLSITKAGNTLLRRLLVGSAHYILGVHGPDCDLRRYGERLMTRGGKNAKKRALVAVARKLAVLLHRLWVNGEVYDPLHSEREDRQGSVTSLRRGIPGESALDEKPRSR
jgi:transposase